MSDAPRHRSNEHDSSRRRSDERVRPSENRNGGSGRPYDIGRDLFLNNQQGGSSQEIPRRPSHASFGSNLSEAMTRVPSADLRGSRRQSELFSTEQTRRHSHASFGSNLSGAMTRVPSADLRGSRADLPRTSNYQDLTQQNVLVGRGAGGSTDRQSERRGPSSTESRRDGGNSRQLFLFPDSDEDLPER
jgi:hypothetical protein